MKELIAKRYVKALNHSDNIDSLKTITFIFEALSESFSNDKFTQIINNPDVSKNQKSEILLASVKSSDSKEVNNLIKLLVENNRINIIPAIAEVLRKEIASISKEYNGIIYSDEPIDNKVVADLSAGLGKKFKSNIILSFVKNDFNGIKVDVADLGIEINFSNSRINSQIIEHIVKAV